MTEGYFVYLMASGRHGTLYVGVTSDLKRRVWQHRRSGASGFTERYGVTRLVWYEAHGDVNVAIRREKTIKRWRRAWKVALIEEENGDWNDLYAHLFGVTPNELAVWDEKFPE